MSDLISRSTVNALWIAWLLYWAFRAWGVRRNERGEALGARVATALVLALGGYLIFGPITPLGPLNRRFVPEAVAIQTFALAMILAGFGITIWARHHLGQFWSGRVMLKVGHELIQTGPYAQVRHPIYSGIFLAMLGTALFVGEWRALLGTAIFFVGHWVKARREEELLATQFGAEYEEYRQRTGSLLPRLR
jgi:protein-S-isoprenylcysteine O-methyltransferase Ste14